MDKLNKNIKKAFQPSLRFLLVILTIFTVFNSFGNSASAYGSFHDLGGVKWAENSIYYLTDRGTIGGYGNGKFGPTDKITRAQAAAYLVRELYPNETSIVNPNFSDVTTKHYFYNAIAIATEKGIFSGLPGNRFAPDAPITRAQTAAILVNAYHIGQGAASVHFTDLYKASWAQASVINLATSNFVNGYADNTFRPNNSITRAEFAAILANVVKVKDPSVQKPELTAHFIDVGQGDSTLIETPNGKTILIDGGKSSAGDKVVSYLQAHRISSIDLLVATHPDADHIGGLNAVLEQIEVKRVLDSGKTHTTDTYLNYMSLIDQKNIPFEVAQTGQIIDLDSDVTIQVLNSNDVAPSDDMNDSSVVLKVTYGTVDFILTGDATVDNEAAMVANFDVDAEVLKVGHHGSDTSTSQAFVNEVTPEVAILSYGENNYGHPDAGVVSRLRNAGSDIFSTYESGDIDVTTDGLRYDVSASPWSGNGVGATEPAPEPTPTTSTGKLDITGLSLSDEYVIIKNIDTKNISMDRWTIVSVDGNQTYRFPAGFVLKQGATVKIVSGNGAKANPPYSLLWTTAYIWDNNGDKAALYDPQGVLIDSLRK